MRRQPVLTCPVHGIPLVSFCPACRGAKGGKVVTPKKRASLRRIARERTAKRPAGGSR